MPFFWSTGDNTGYGHHADFMNGWQVDKLQLAVDTCTAASGVVEDCPVFTFWNDDVQKGCKHEFFPSSGEDFSGMVVVVVGEEEGRRGSKGLGD